MTSKLEIVKFEPYHMDLLRIKKEHQFLTDWIDNVYTDRSELGVWLQSRVGYISYLKPSIATFKNDEEILGVVALIYTEKPGVMEAICYFSDNFKDHYRSVLKFMKNAVDNTEFKRLQAYVDVDSKDANRFAKFFGFKKEGLMKKFGLGLRDQYSYSIVRD
jgi:RimJ/RimL family protein N-acetyltransferase